MGGGPGTPELIAAVANAGGLGSFGGGYLDPAEIRSTIARIRSLTDRPLNVNLFAGGYHSLPGVDPAAMLAILSRVHERLGIAPPVMPRVPPDPFPVQLEVVLEAKPEVFSFTFGVPDAISMSRLHDAGIVVIGTATTLEEARILANANVDAVVAQGAEAGAHRGTFATKFEDAMLPLLDLVERIVANVQIPVIASGGLMDGHDIAAALARGAVAAQLGTAFLACPESGASDAYKRAVLDAAHDTTVVTRAYSGRAARGIRNEFIENVPEEAIIAYPHQNSLTRPMRAAAARVGDARYLSLWAGTGVARARAMPAKELMAALIAEMS